MFNRDAIVQLAKEAGERVLEVYEKDFSIYTKNDESPLTEADLVSHNTIVKGLAELTPEIPVLSEESGEQALKDRLDWDCYWLIDPLDGTKEFIKKNGEFTINIALIKSNVPVFGVVYAPVLGVTYWGSLEEGAYKRFDTDNKDLSMTVSKIPQTASDWRVVGSRSHQSDEFIEFVSGFDEPEIVAMGSSLKLCLVAAGEADIYPRLGLTSEWDTAAAQAVVEAAGGKVLEYPSLEPLRYNTRPETVLNPFFIVCADLSPCWVKQES